MPVATVQSEPQRFELKSLSGAFVEIRRMDQGERMRRQELINKAKFKAKRGSRDVDVEMDIINSAVVLFEWANLIVDHNLEYLKVPSDPTSATKMDFRNADHVRKVDGKVSEEINTYIGDVNNFEPDEDDGQGNS